MPADAAVTPGSRWIRSSAAWKNGPRWFGGRFAERGSTRA
jgi:hypothetical protein